MVGALFYVSIPTEKHEIHISQHIMCNCSTKTKYSSIKKKNYCLSAEEKPRFHFPVSMEKTMDSILSSLKISNSVWTLSKDNRCYSITFSIASNEHCEHILDLFMENNIGVKLNSVLGVLPCSLYYQDPEADQPTFESHQKVNSSNLYQSSWKTFLQSVRSRLTVAQVVQGVEAGAMLTFDFLILLVISVTVAALGLIQGEIIIFVSSMLLSPLMGPINAATFGTMIKDKKLRNMGIMNEIIGLILCVIIGFCYGLISSYFDKRDSSQWVTNEMAYMTDIKSLWVSVVLAFLVGIAVPIALLGNNTFSLVGVAISTSLLPPSVNAGLLWAFSIRSINQDSNNTINSQYSSTRSIDFAIKGAMSMSLTFINIICIFACGIVILKIKAVAPKGHNYTKISMNEYLKALEDINLGQKEEPNYLTLRLKEEYVASVFGFSANSLKIRSPCLTPGYNPFDLTFVTWSPGYNSHHNEKTDLNSHTDIRTSKLLQMKRNNSDTQYNSENSPKSLKAIFESPKKNHSAFVDSDNTTYTSTKRFVITPATLKNNLNT